MICCYIDFRLREWRFVIGAWAEVIARARRTLTFSRAVEAPSPEGPGLTRRTPRLRPVEAVAAFPGRKVALAWRPDDLNEPRVDEDAARMRLPVLEGAERCYRSSCEVHHQGASWEPCRCLGDMAPPTPETVT